MTGVVMRRVFGCSVLLAGSCLSAPSLAQQAQPAATEDSAGEENAGDTIVVTGTRVSRSALDFANPVVTLSAQAIQDSGHTNLADLLVQSPALVGSVTGAQTGGSLSEFGEAGLDLLNLRNLGTDRTLVLVDGR